jgi:GNAT superfamily N-acetyltransferase
MLVHRRARRRGIGSALMRAAEDSARSDFIRGSDGFSQAPCPIMHSGRAADSAAPVSIIASSLDRTSRHVAGSLREDYPPTPFPFKALPISPRIAGSSMVAGMVH